MNIFKNLSSSLALLVFVGFAAFAPLLTGDTIGIDKLAEALDSPSSVTFTAKCTNAAVVKSYTDGGNIGNAEGTGAGRVLPVAGSSFLQMTGSGSPVNGLRPARVRSTFAFQVAGAGTLSFNYRAATYGSDDDVLIFYTSDIDDTLFEASGEYWGVRYYDKDAQEYVYDLLENDFFNDGEFSFDTTKYARTVTVALLAPAKEDYTGPDADEKKENVIKYQAWLDNFVWTPDETAVLCGFSPAPGSDFGGFGAEIFLMTDYMDSDGNPAVTFRYTLDGSAPTASSPVYKETVEIGEDGTETVRGIQIDETTTVRVAVFEGSKLIRDDLSATYTLRDAPSAPVAAASLQEPFDGTMDVVVSAATTASSLMYYYTVDGSEPTSLSKVAEKGICQVTGPCILKVRASDEGILGETATFQVVQDPAPAFSVLAELEGYPSGNGLFDTKASLSISAAEGHRAFYRLGASAPQAYSTPIDVFSDTTIEAVSVRTEEVTGIVSGGVCPMNSAPVSIALRKSDSNDDGKWITDLDFTQGWNLLPITREISYSMGKDLAAWLNPYGYSPEENSFNKVESLASGNSYWVYLPDGTLPSSGKPAFRSLSREGEANPPDGSWRLVDKNALFFYNGTHFLQVKPEDNLPGWKK